MFLTAPSANSDRSPFGDFWFEPVAVRTMSGARVNADTAMRLSAVFRAVWLLSGHIALLPITLKKRGALKKIDKHPLLSLFRKPNAWQNGMEWRQMLQGHLMLRGNAYNEIIDNARGEITALMPLHPDRVKVEMNPGSTDYRYRVTNQDGTERILARGQVWHLRGLMSNGIVGLSVIECARESMGLGLAAQEYGARFFANDAKPTGGWIKYPGKFADKTARQIFRESVQQAQSDANRGKIMVLDNNMEYHEVGLTNKDSQFLETRKFQISDIARWFGIPPHKMADLERATFSNIEQQALEYVTDSLMIWTEIWEAAIEDALLFDDEELDVDFDFSKLLRGDSQTRANNNQKLVASGIITRNEARADEGREPLPGLDEPLRPLNMVEESDTEDDEEEEDEQEAAPSKGQPDPEGDDGDENARRFQAMLQSNASRLARRIVKTGGPIDSGLVAEALAVTPAQAAAWCAETPVGTPLEDLTASLIALGSQK
jgi:HK97 family phage portal protein